MLKYTNLFNLRNYRARLERDTKIPHSIRIVEKPTLPQEKKLLRYLNTEFW